MNHSQDRILVSDTRTHNGWIVQRDLMKFFFTKKNQKKNLFSIVLSQLTIFVWPVQMALNIFISSKTIEKHSETIKFYFSSCKMVARSDTWLAIDVLQTFVKSFEGTIKLIGFWTFDLFVWCIINRKTH